MFKLTRIRINSAAGLGVARPGWAWHGGVGSGMARPGVVWQGAARLI